VVVVVEHEERTKTCVWASLWRIRDHQNNQNEDGEKRHYPRHSVEGHVGVVVQAEEIVTNPRPEVRHGQPTVTLQCNCRHDEVIEVFVYDCASLRCEKQESGEQRAQSREQEAGSGEQRGKSREKRAESRE
jgi:hypothetical protein